ncbi:MAG: hypothetical protein R8G66_08395 [Cytophagales bacterium]|nr:hypothetical protein [Cytophagales bacterium]
MGKNPYLEGNYNQAMKIPSCPPAPANKAQYINEIGHELVATYGKKDFYNPEEVRQIHRKKSKDTTVELDPDFVCWAMSIFSSHEDFDEYHLSKGDSCDYIEMRQEMLGGSESSIWDDLISMPDIDMDASWISFTEVLGSVSDGVGSILSGLTDLLDI